MSGFSGDLGPVYWLAQLAMSFCIYSFAGWLYEVVIGLFQHRRFINRGFNFGPVCPIYGVGAVLAIVGLAPLGNPLVQFAVGFFAAGILEYTTSWAMEALFHARWWDYSDFPLNLNGRICLLGLLVFSVLMLGVNYVSEPFLKGLYALVDPNVFVLVSWALVTLFCMDFTASVVCMQGFMDKLRGMQANISNLSTRAHEAFAALVQAASEKLPRMDDLKTSAREAVPTIADAKAALAKVVPGIRELRDDVVESLRQFADPQVRDELQDKLGSFRERGWSRYERKSLNDPWFRVTQSSEAFEWARQAFPFRSRKKGDDAAPETETGRHPGASGDASDTRDGGVY